MTGAFGIAIRRISVTCSIMPAMSEPMPSAISIVPSSAGSPVRGRSICFVCSRYWKIFGMLNPKPISDTTVRVHAISVRSEVIQVRS